MATAPGKSRCITCGKERATAKCGGCLEDYCLKHLVQHRQELTKQLDEIEVHCDLFQQIITQQTTDSHKHPLIQQINQWEEESIQKIKQTAKEIRETLLIYTNEHINQMKEKLNQLTNQLKLSRDEDDLIETDLQKWKNDLQQMTVQVNLSPNILIQQSSTPLINKIQVEFSALISIPIISDSARWIQNGITVAGGNGYGNALNQLYDPWGVDVDDDQTIYVADWNNHRIMEWKKGATMGEVVAGGNGAGNRNDQLNYPSNVIVDKQNDSLIISDWNNERVVRWPRRNGKSGETIISNVRCYGLAMDNDGYLYVSDIKKQEVKRWKIGEMNGAVVAGGNGQGNRFDQLSGPYFICVDQDHSVYVSDHDNHRVMKWMKGAREGIVVAGGQGKGNSLTQLSNSRGVIVDQLGTVYVAEQSNHRVMRWRKGAREGSVVVGGNGQGEQANQFYAPHSLSFDRQNNLYVVDFGNHRVQKFHIESNL